MEPPRQTYQEEKPDPGKLHGERKPAEPTRPYHSCTWQFTQLTLKNPHSLLLLLISPEETNEQSK